MKTGSEMNELESLPYEFPKLVGRNVLVVGLGGGCDIISAYALAVMLKSANPEKIVYGNTKRPSREMEKIARSHVQPLAGLPRSVDEIGYSIPDMTEDCPLVFTIPWELGESLIGEIAEEVAALNCDLLIGVDTGGDSLFDNPLTGSEGRDKQMLRVLQSVDLPLLHVVFAPGSDGETTYGEMRSCFAEKRRLGEYRGCFSLEPMIPLMKQLAAHLRKERTPNIIVAAFEDCLTRPDPPDFVEIPRCLQPLVPRTWLQKGFVFQSGGHAANDAVFGQMESHEDSC
jgi:hypothetical protein